MTSIDILGAQASVRTYDVLTTGMVGATVEFRFDKSWDNLVRTAVFRQGAVTKDVVNIGTTAKIPPEVLMIPGLSVKIGVLGTNSDGTVVIPTVWAETRPVKDGTDPSGDESADPTLPVWEQILATIGDMHSLSTEAKGNLVASINELVQLCEDGTVDAEYIQQEVEKYLKENPVTETDPTVPAWAKQPEKPKYTAQEVGALSADTVIPTIPDNVSAFRNDAGYLTEHQDISGKLDANKLPEAINTALAQAKASGEFDGKDGADGYTPQKGIDYFDGKDGQDGSPGADGIPGEDGVSATHSWNGTVLTINSASGTSSADLKGAKGDKGDQGIQGIQGEKGDKGDTGAAGKTPVKGTDYFTDADKAEMVEDVLDSMDGIPSYWQSHLDSKVALIREAMLTAGVNKSAFLFYSDAHWSNATTYTAKKAPALLKYLCKNAPINKTNFGGDIVSAEAADAATMAYLWEWRNQLYGLPNHHSVPGNHDDGNSTNNLFSEQYVYGYLLAPEETCDIVRGDEGMYYYIDNPAEKTRYLYLDTAYKGVTTAEQEFVKAALLSAPENWHIVAIAHLWYHNDYTTYPPVLTGFDTNAKILLDMFDNFNTRQGAFAECTAWVEFCIGGHYHLDHVEHTSGGIPVIIVEADTLHDRSGTMPNAGTTDESAISAVIADYNTNTVKIIRVGRGEDYNAKIEIKTVSYTNVIPLSIDKDGNIFNGGKGWADNSRIGSGGIYLGNGTHYVTGHIEIDPNIDNVFRLRNMTFDSTTSNSYAYGMVTFDSSFARAKYDGSSDVLYSDTSLAANAAVWDTVIEGNNIVQFTLKASAITNKNIKYVAICCSGISDDSIITINEPID